MNWCANAGCTVCGQRPRDRGSFQDSYDSPQPLEDITTQYNMADCAPSKSEAAHEDPHYSQVSRACPAMTCGSCSLTSWDGIAEWRICDCMRTLCTSCSSVGCEVCGRRHLSAAWPAIAHTAVPIDAVDNIADRERMSDVTVLTPHQAHARRLELLSKHAAGNRDRRTQRRATAKAQMRAGVRPRRDRRGGSEITIGTVNPNTAQKLREELATGGELARCDYLAVQETNLRDDQMSCAMGWLRKAKWDGALDAAYRKHEGHGGGTAIITRHPAGIRQVGAAVNKLKGRVTIGTTCFGSAVAIVSFYGFSGGSLTAQLPYWKELIDLLLRLGLPFIVAADWQRPPGDLSTAGVCHLLDAAVCAPACATNLLSGNKLDYFLVSKCLLHGDWRVFPLPATRSGRTSPSFSALVSRQRRIQPGAFRSLSSSPSSAH